MLLKNGLKAKLIQSNEDFILASLTEVRYFSNQLFTHSDTYLIPEDLWDSAKGDLKRRHLRSTKLDSCLALIRDFERSHPLKKYKSDWEVFLRESKLEDFHLADQETILVSTMHKVKGREFDQVFLMLDNYRIDSDSDKRLLYVAMTRAKKNLTIHLNSGFLDDLETQNLKRIEDQNPYLPSTCLTKQLTFKDVWLDYFTSRQYLVNNLTSGDQLTLNESGCENSKGKSVLKFSQKFLQEMNELKRKGFMPKSSKVNFILYWRKEEDQQEYQVILPEIEFERKEPIQLS
jgi:ATP-dependent DNA helicase RecQ